METLNVFDFEALAREKLSREAYDYYAGGAHDEVTLRENRAAYDRLSLAYRALRACPSSALCYGMHCVGTAVIAAKATQDQEERYLRPINLDAPVVPASEQAPLRVEQGRRC